jgi:predicted dehydrogenase
LPSHADLVTLALDAGCHVLVEKPLAACSGSTRELLNYAASRDRLLCPVHQFLFQPGVLDIQARLPELGRLLHIDAVACSAGAVGDFAREPDLLIPEILPHPLALVAKFSKRPVSSMTWHIEHTWPGEMRAVTSVNGVSVALMISSNGRPTTNSLRLVGTRATAHLDLFHGFAVIEPGAVSRTSKITQPFGHSTRTFVAASTNLLRRALHDEPAYPGLRELIGRFHQAVRQGTGAPISPDEVLDVAMARDALAASMLWHRRQ